MRLSDLKPEQIKLVSAGEAPAELKLSELNPGDFQLVTKGEKVYDQPIGPEQESAVDRFKERVTDPQRWKAILTGSGPYASKVVQGDVPLAIPGGAIPKLAKAATALAEGQGLGYALGRTALSTGQGAAMSAASGGDVEHGAKLAGGIQAAVEAIPVVGKAAGFVGRKVGQALTGVNEKMIENYAKRTDQVNDIIKQSGGDITTAADQVRTELSAGIQSTKRQLNSQISKTLEGASPDPSISIEPIIQRLQAAKAKLNPNFKGSAIAEIEEMIRAIQSESKDGLVNAQGLYQIKQFLNEGSKGAYNKGGQIFTRASEAARAAKDGAAEAREGLRVSAPEISAADAQLAKLHAIEGRLNRNLLAPGKPDGALMAAGSGGNPRNAATLRELEKISGVPVSQRANDLATAREFANPGLLPADWTGKAMARMAVGAGLGGAMDGKEGAVIGGALASPMALKLGLNAANVAKTAANATKVPALAEAIRNNPTVSQLVAHAGDSYLRKENSESDLPTTSTPMLGSAQGNRDVASLKGESKWASDGAKRLGLDDATTSKLMQSKEGRALLIRASDLKPGNQELKRIKEKIQRGIYK